MDEKLIKGAFPVDTKTITVEVLEQPTEFLVSKFSNKLFVIITQIGKVGSLVEVKTQELQKGRFTDIVHDTRVILGKDDVDLHTAARFLANLIGASCNVLFALSLKNYNKETIKKIGESLKLHPCLSSSA